MKIQHHFNTVNSLQIVTMCCKYFEQHFSTLKTFNVRSSAFMLYGMDCKGSESVKYLSLLQPLPSNTYMLRVVGSYLVV